MPSWPWPEESQGSDRTGIGVMWAIPESVEDGRQPSGIALTRTSSAWEEFKGNARTSSDSAGAWSTHGFVVRESAPMCTVLRRKWHVRGARLGTECVQLILDRLLEKSATRT
jgi:hypothetical protein